MCQCPSCFNNWLWRIGIRDWYNSASRVEGQFYILSVCICLGHECNLIVEGDSKASNHKRLLQTFIFKQ